MHDHDKWADRYICTSSLLGGISMHNWQPEERMRRQVGTNSLPLLYVVAECHSNQNAMRE